MCWHLLTSFTHSVLQQEPVEHPPVLAKAMEEGYLMKEEAHRQQHLSRRRQYAFASACLLSWWCDAGLMQDVRTAGL